MAGRRCVDCPTVIPAGSYRGRCPDCLRAWDRARGNRTQRGYGASVWRTPLGTMTYDACRAAFQRMLDDGATISCACGCDKPVPRQGWHLAHDDERTRIVGPMLSGCNLRLAGRASAETRRA